MGHGARQASRLARGRAPPNHWLVTSPDPRSRMLYVDLHLPPPHCSTMGSPQRNGGTSHREGHRQALRFHPCQVHGQQPHQGGRQPHATGGTDGLTASLAYAAKASTRSSMQTLPPRPPPLHPTIFWHTHITSRRLRFIASSLLTNWTAGSSSTRTTRLRFIAPPSHKWPGPHQRAIAE